MKTAKDAILKLIPTGETALRSAIQSSSGTKNSLGHTLITAFGFNTSLWADWQKEVETTYLNTPDSHFATFEDDDTPSVKEWLLESVGKRFDGDGQYGAQCKDLANAYALWLEHPLKPGDAAEAWVDEQDVFWQKIPHRSSTIPQLGDLVVWPGSDTNPYGHIAIIMEADAKGFTSVDQNWIDSNLKTGSPAALITHTYTTPDVLGYLRPSL